MKGTITVHHGDSREVLKTLPDASIDGAVGDPPYALVSITKRFGAEGAAPAKSEGPTGAYTRASAGFMGQAWDTGETAFDPAFWREVYRVLKPGGHLIMFGGTRTYHRLAVAIEDAGFEIRDMVAWLYGSGFPKSHDVAKAIDRRNGLEGEWRPEEHFGRKGDRTGPSMLNQTNHTRSNNPDGARHVYVPGSPEAEEWEGWGTALKPALEPCVIARKPLIGTVAENVLEHGTGALNIDACRIAAPDAPEAARVSTRTAPRFSGVLNGGETSAPNEPRKTSASSAGRWPANVAHDGSDEVVAAFPVDAGGGHHPASRGGGGIGTSGHSGQLGLAERSDGRGSAARFFYAAKADAEDRAGSKHPTVKPVDLMAWLVRLVIPRGGVVLDPFAGTGTTGIAAARQGVNAILIEREERFVRDIRRRIELEAQPRAARRTAKVPTAERSGAGTPLFGSLTGTDE